MSKTIIEFEVIKYSENGYTVDPTTLYVNGHINFIELQKMVTDLDYLKEDIIDIGIGKSKVITMEVWEDSDDFKTWMDYRLITEDTCKFNKGRWYNKEGTAVIVLCNKYGDTLVGNGVSILNHFVENGSWGDDAVEITPEQAGVKLIKTCKENGYHVCDNVIDLNSGDVIKSLTARYQFNDGKVYLSSACIFDINKGFAEKVST